MCLNLYLFMKLKYNEDIFNVLITATSIQQYEKAGL